MEFKTPLVEKLNTIDQIESRICELQKTLVALQEQFKQSQHHTDRTIDDSALRIIDILDLIQTTQISMNNNTEQSSNGPLIIKKIEKRLLELLKHWKVLEIQFVDGRIEAGRTRVLEVRETSEIASKGLIIEVCRKGYQRNKKVIRPADVITGG